MGFASLSRLSRAALGAAVLGFGAAALPSLAAAQQPGTVKSNHGAWSIVCDQPAGASGEQCALMQNVLAEDRPELGLSNWEHGRLFARGGVLSGDGVFTVRARVRQSDPNLDRNPATAKTL